MKYVLPYVLNEFILFANPKKILWQRRKQRKKEARKRQQNAPLKKQLRKVRKKEQKKEQEDPLRKEQKNVNKKDTKKPAKIAGFFIYRESKLSSTADSLIFSSEFVPNQLAHPIFQDLQFHQVY